MRAEPFRLRRPAPRAHVAPAARRGWLSHGVAGLAVTALGLGLAASIASPTHAETPSSPVGGVTVGSAPRAGASPSPSVDPSVTEPFTRAGQQPEPLRKAIVAERAAQRAEELAKAADEVTRAGLSESGKNRQDQLSEDEKATQAKSAELAKEALDRAIAVRIAAAKARAEAEAAAGQAIQLPPTASAPAADPAQPAAPAAPAAPAPAAPAPAPISGGAAVAPVPNAVIGAHFGEYGLWSRYHTGLDFRAGYGVPIRAVKSGIVLYAGNSGDWAGNHVAVRHADGMTSMSSHMSRMAVSAGQTVQAGQVIGYVGQTGRAFGPHLHFELYPAGVTYGDVYRAIDPLPWLRAAGVQAG